MSRTFIVIGWLLVPFVYSTTHETPNYNNYQLNQVLFIVTFVYLSKVSSAQLLSQHNVRPINLPLISDLKEVTLSAAQTLTDNPFYLSLHL